MGCVSSNLLNHEDDFPQLGSSALGVGHHIVSLTSTTYGLLSLDPPPNSTPPSRFTLGSVWSEPRPLRSDPPEVINSWELMAGLDADSFRFSPLLPSPKPFKDLTPSDKENSHPNRFTLSNRFKKPSTPTKPSLDRFPRICPPNGENRVVVYTTTLRGVRRTFEACNAVRAAFEAFGVMICERDVSMDSGFKEELRELLKGKEREEMVPPRVFVKGMYIGSAEELVKAVEEGLLGEILEGLPRKRVGAVCEGCGDMRFLPCFRCNGSCKTVVVVKEKEDAPDDDDAVLKQAGRTVVIKCSHCNENGLVVEWKKVKRLCRTKPLLTVNGEYPGPTIAIDEGDNVEIKVSNSIAENTTIHWHGIKQIRTGWADGPAYITQCPIKGGHSYTYKFKVVNQRGTLLWHAHYSWQRASVYGAFIIYPRMPYPFSAPLHAQVPIIFGEWWNTDVNAMQSEMIKYGSGPNSSDAYTINGLPGPLYPCSNKDTFIYNVESGKTYLLRIINAAMSDELYFAVANHTLTVVEIDATYTKPFTTPAIMVTPGQTTNVLLNANQIPHSSGMFAMAARPYRTSVFPFDNSTSVGFLRYSKAKTAKNKPFHIPTNPAIHNLPEMEDIKFAAEYSSKLRSLASSEYPCKVPQQIDKRVVTTISLNLQDCPANSTCKGYEGKRFSASMNNQSFVRPSMSILDSYYKKINNHEYSLDFPEKPPEAFNYTGVDPLKDNMNTEFGTKILSLPYGTNLEIVLQDTGFLNVENHPIHVHGHNFFVVGQGIGNYNVDEDPANYNLVDPPERNTVGVPKGGWAAIRLKAENPGVWFIHCHLEEHTSWGLAMAFIVKDGPSASQCLLPPPEDFPPC